MLEQTLVVGPFQCNCRLIACPRTGLAALIDPGDESERIVAELKGARVASGAPVEVRYLFHTHAHLDHVAGTRGVRTRLGEGAKILLHRGDEELYRMLKMQGQLFGLDYDDPLPIDRFIEHEEELELGDLRLAVIHTPGHSPGSVCLRLHENSGAKAGETLYSGDTLFQGSVGRTDLWGADGELMFKNIRERLLTLDGDTRVCPGHGPDTRIGIEKKENPFLI